MVHTNNNITLYTLLLDNFPTFDKELLWKLMDDTYNQSNRYHHTLTHIIDMLSVAVKLKDNKFYLELLLAIVFHDVIYMIPDKYKMNEKASGDIATIVGPQIFYANSNIDWEAVRLLILSTQYEIPEAQRFYTNTVRTTDVDFVTARNVLIDLDNAILASEYYYKTYAENIKKEYLQSYTEEEYIFGRIKFLKNMIEQKCIFKTSFLSEFDSKAKQNMINELLSYKSQSLITRIKLYCKFVYFNISVHLSDIKYFLFEKKF